MAKKNVVPAPRSAIIFFAKIPMEVMDSAANHLLPCIHEIGGKELESLLNGGPLAPKPKAPRKPKKLKSPAKK